MPARVGGNGSSERARNKSMPIGIRLPLFWRPRSLHAVAKRSPIRLREDQEARSHGEHEPPIARFHQYLHLRRFFVSASIATLTRFNLTLVRWRLMRRAPLSLPWPVPQDPWGRWRFQAINRARRLGKRIQVEGIRIAPSRSDGQCANRQGSPSGGRPRQVPSATW